MLFGYFFTAIPTFDASFKLSTLKCLELKVSNNLVRVEPSANAVIDFSTLQISWTSLSLILIKCLDIHPYHLLTNYFSSLELISELHLLLISIIRKFCSYSVTNSCFLIIILFSQAIFSLPFNMSISHEALTQVKAQWHPMRPATSFRLIHLHLAKIISPRPGQTLVPHEWQ